MYCKNLNNFTPVYLWLLLIKPQPLVGLNFSCSSLFITTFVHNPIIKVIKINDYAIVMV